MIRVRCPEPTRGSALMQRSGLALEPRFSSVASTAMLRCSRCLWKATSASMSPWAFRHWHFGQPRDHVCWRLKIPREQRIDRLADKMLDLAAEPGGPMNELDFRMLSLAVQHWYRHYNVATTDHATDTLCAAAINVLRERWPDGRRNRPEAGRSLCRLASDQSQCAVFGLGPLTLPLATEALRHIGPRRWSCDCVQKAGCVRLGPVFHEIRN